MSYLLKVYASILVVFIVASLAITAFADNPVNGPWLTAFFICVIAGFRLWSSNEADRIASTTMVTGAFGLIPNLPWYVISIGSIVLGTIAVRRVNRQTPTLHTAVRLRDGLAVILMLIVMSLMSTALAHPLHSEDFQNSLTYSMVLIGFTMLLVCIRPHPERWKKYPKSNWRTRHDRYRQQ